MLIAEDLHQVREIRLTSGGDKTPLLLRGANRYGTICVR
jgi:hypothetical protein